VQFVNRAEVRFNRVCFNRSVSIVQRLLNRAAVRFNRAVCFNRAVLIVQGTLIVQV
jgi:hypothetical protein